MDAARDGQARHMCPRACIHAAVEGAVGGATFATTTTTNSAYFPPKAPEAPEVAAYYIHVGQELSE